MNEKYQMEIDNFIQRFKLYQNERIILYGIGRYTMTLLEGLKGFNIVGLMDKDSSNIGKVIQNIPIVDNMKAEEIADMVIINTAETYWDIIYNRIKDIKLPIYYLNGKKAVLDNGEKKTNLLKGVSYLELMMEIEGVDVISFDFFDTLFMRSVCSSQDIFRLMEIQMQIPFLQMRNRAKKDIKENYSLNELYARIEILENIPQLETNQIKNFEIELEKKLLIPRRPIISLLRDLLGKNKKIYVISDMYLPKEFYVDVLKNQGVIISEEALLLSNELDANKLDGTLWEYYAKNIVEGRSSIHIGDNIRADIQEPKKYDIKTYLIPNVWEILLNSSLRNMAPRICSIYESAVMGCVLDRLFENPFVLEETNGTAYIRNNHDMGYCVFGPVIITFMLWLLDKIEEDGIEKLVFMARDGYFLKEDFEYICELLGKKTECCYIGISRQLAMIASIETKQDLMEYAKMPYSGTVIELIEDRFGICCNNISQHEQLEACIDICFPEIMRKITEIKQNYLKYLRQFELYNQCAVVDIGYYGNNQRYLNKLLNIHMMGYYFNANLSTENINVKIQHMRACFQNDYDSVGEYSNILKKQLYLESFLTAPYGMVKAVDENGSLVCTSDRKNQEYFKDKAAINEGVKQFIADYVNRFGMFGIRPNIEFIDQFYGCCFGKGMRFADEVKRSFYNDNAMMNRIESNLFY